jgi:NhaP-type Na+/H+ or K+/H+ antiporter
VGLPLTKPPRRLPGAGLLPGIGLGEALVLAVMLACTDAALGQAVVTDERIPLRIRQGLNIESGLNDGLCVPLFFIAIAIAEAQEGIISSHLALHLVAEEIGYGLIAGVVAGASGAIGLGRSSRAGALGRHWTQILTASSALLAAGIASGLGGSIFIAAFTGGATFSLLRRDGGDEEATDLLDDAGAMLNAVTFVVFGAVVLGALADEITWQIVVYAIVSLTAVRMLPVALGLVGTGAGAATVGFMGWFGPRGLASIVFGVILLDDADLPHARTLLVATATTIAISVYAHGLTAPPLTRRFVRWCTAHPGAPLTGED